MLEELIRDARFEASSKWYRAKEKLLFWAVWKMPRRLIEIAAVRCWANATSGPFGNESPTDTTVDVALKRWMKGEGGDKTFHPSEVSY
jgi:hypothetical protein